MLTRIRKGMDEKEQGFTLIELLVVIIIIGILAAIAIPVFLNQRQKATESSLKSDLRTVANEVETYFVDEQAYPADGDVTSAPGTTTIDGTAVGVSSGNTVDYKTITGGYCLTGTNSDANVKTWYYNSTDGGITETAC